MLKKLILSVFYLENLTECQLFGMSKITKAHNGCQLNNSPNLLDLGTTSLLLLMLADRSLERRSDRNISYLAEMRRRVADALVCVTSNGSW